MPFPRPARFLAGACLAAVVAGCGPSTAEVSGVVTINGAPPKLQGLQISFMAPDGRPASAFVGEDGSYKAVAVPVGENNVAFVYVSPEQVRSKGGMKVPKPGQGAPEMGPPPAPPYNPIPVPLREPSTSRVTCRVEGGKRNNFSYDIKP